MNLKPIKTLLIEDNPGDARLIQEELSEARGASFEIEWTDRLSRGLDLLAGGAFDAGLLDLGLPDSMGLNTLRQVRAEAADVPVVVLTGLGDEALALEALDQGAQDYLVKGRVDRGLLERSVRYAIERQRMMVELRGASLIDELTGLYNRRGFFVLARQQLKLADRTNADLSLFFADLDGMKWINDTFGHHEGDLALISVANVLRRSFRQSDVIGRLGGDEFAILAVGGSESGPETLATRLRERLVSHNGEVKRRYGLSLSIGVARYNPEHPSSIEDLLERADALMYDQKRSKENGKSQN